MPDIISERWHMLTTDVEWSADHVPMEGNSKAMSRLMDTLDTFAVRMVHEIRGDDEENALDAFRTELLEDIEKRMANWATQIEFQRQRPRAADR